MKKLNFIAGALIISMMMVACKRDAAESVEPELNMNANAEVPTLQVAFPNQEGVTKTGYWQGSQIEYTSYNGVNILEGDMAIKDSLITSHPVSEGTVGTQSTGIKGAQYRWVDGRVYYKIDPSLPNKARVTQAIAHWEKKSSLRFIERTSQANFIYFTAENGCWSYYGKQGGKQLISLGQGCTTGTAIHEIGHAIGLFHEQSRSDRNNFVDIKWENIIEKYKHNFKTWVGLGYQGIDYGDKIDNLSIMMYHPWSFSKNGKPTITWKSGSIYKYQLDTLTNRDVATVEFMYRNQ